MSIQQEKFKEIADAIREKTNSTDKIKPSEFAGKVDEVYEAGKTKGIEEGKKAQNEEFWASVPSGAHIAFFKDMFAGIVWNKNNFYPTINIAINTNQVVDNMFFGHNMYSDPYDLSQRLSDCGVTFDFSKATRADTCFYQSWLTRLPKLNFSNVSRLYLTFGYMPYLVTIDELIVPEKATYSNAFPNAPNLENLTMGGTIGQNGFDVSLCTKLTHDSLMSIINHLKSGVSGLTVTLGSTNLAKLTAAEKAIATQKGWTLA